MTADQNTRPTPSSDVEEATREAERLARILHKKHFPEVPQWEPLSGDLLGLLSQIDNMTTALERLSASPAQVEVTDEMVERAAIKWCGEKDRETSLDDIRYFRNNWRALPGLRAYVDRETAALTATGFASVAWGLQLDGKIVSTTNDRNTADFWRENNRNCIVVSLYAAPPSPVEGSEQ